MADEEDDWFKRALREEWSDEAGGDDPDDWFGGGLGDGSESEDDPAGATETDESETGGQRADATTEASGLFEEDFGTAFAEAGGDETNVEFGDGFDHAGSGFDDAGGGFDDEAFESNIPRIDLGIGGLDEMIRGGVPERSLMVCLGSAGTGKTTFGLQFLNHSLERGERAVFITLEQDRESILSTASEMGWDFPRYAEDKQLAVVDLDPVEMANKLTNIRNELPALVDEFGATRLVLDSVSLLEMMYDEQATRRTEVYDFTRSLKQTGVTTMLTSEASDRTAYASRHGIIEYLTDAVFVLRYIRPDDFRETRLAVEIQKIRDTSHVREMKPYEISDEGISVYRQANIF